MSRWINRAAIVVRPRQPYLDWAASLDDEAPEHAKEMGKRISIYLVAEDPAENAETVPLENYFQTIFEAELAAWSQDEDQWPQSRTLAMLLQWFEVTGESVVTDLESGPIKHERA